MNQLSKDEMESQIVRVREDRAVYETLKNEVKQLEVKLNEEYKDRYEARNAALVKLSNEEDLLRKMAIDAYLEDGNKKPAPGVGIRVVKKCEYDAEKALEWAISRGACLKLNDFAFRKAALGNVFSDIPVTIIEEPQATLAETL